MPKSRAPRPPQEAGVRRVVFSTGKVFYELHAERERLGLGGEVALVRIEQLAPFPFDLVCRELFRCGGGCLAARARLCVCVCGGGVTGLEGRSQWGERAFPGTRACTGAL